MTIAPLVYAITLNWNRCDDTLACLQSLTELKYPNKRLLLVDNGSLDDTPKIVAQQYPQVEQIINEKNLGFAAGFNKGLRYALDEGGDYFLIINNDAIIDPQALKYMLTFMKPNVGMISPLIYYKVDPMRIWSAGGKRHPLTIEKIGDVRNQIDEGQWHTILERDYFTGCVLLLSRRLLTEVGLFDEQFFMYYEDSDLSLRARCADFKLLLVPQAKAWHKVAKSSGGSDSPNERYWMARSSVTFFIKHVNGLRWLIVLPYRMGSAIKTILRLFQNKRYDSVYAYLRGLRDGLMNYLPEG